jgi:hypothetical protein
LWLRLLPCTTFIFKEILAERRGSNRPKEKGIRRRVLCVWRVRREKENQKLRRALQLEGTKAVSYYLRHLPNCS